jgi:hypothetical protein
MLVATDSSVQHLGAPLCLCLEPLKVLSLRDKRLASHQIPVCFKLIGRGGSPLFLVLCSPCWPQTFSPLDSGFGVLG